MKSNNFRKKAERTAIFMILAILLAFGTYDTAGTLLNTEIPVIAVVSNSMSHQLEKRGSNFEICGKLFGDNKKLDFNDFWSYCGEFYNNSGISKGEFAEFAMSNGFRKGALIVVKGEENYKIGDVVVYDVRSLINHEEDECRRQAMNWARNGIDRIVHRVVGIENSRYITKGDHNPGKDPCTIKNSEIFGKGVFLIPKLGYLKILISKPAEVFS